MEQLRAKSRITSLAAALLSLSVSLFAGCALDEDDGDPAGDGDGDSSMGGASGDGDVGGALGDGDGDEQWIVGGWLTTEEGWFGYLTILDDLSADGEVDLGQVHQFDGDLTYTSTGDGVVFVGQEGLSTIERWVVRDDGQGLKKDAQIDFDFYGVTSTTASGDVIQVLDSETAWYFDTENYQVIVFNPTTMKTQGETIDFGGLKEGDYNLVLGSISRLDDALVISSQYWDADWNALSLTRVAIIEIDSHEVRYANDTRCGSTRFHATDADGNLYIGPHPGEALWGGADLGSEDAPKPCLVRIKSGSSDFDPKYYVNLQEVSGGKVVGGFMQGTDNSAYVYEYVGDLDAITAENYNSHLRGDNWALAHIELDNEDETYTIVKNYEPSTAYGASFQVRVSGETVTYVISANEGFASGKYYDLSNPTRAVEALSFPGFPGRAFNY